ncbi:MAG: hypothetical protein ACE5G7_02025 [Candidatus Hydrothermarchaeaceae archaeon]
MFGDEEFEKAIKAYEKEISVRGNDEFTSLRGTGKFFSDITNAEGVKEQVSKFVDLVSKMDRDDYGHRYVLQTFLLEFCRYLDKDFLFTLTDGKVFFEMKEKLKDFTGKIYESNKKFTQNVGLHSMEHMLEDYGTLLRYLEDRGQEKGEESYENVFGSFWSQ